MLHHPRPSRSFAAALAAPLLLAGGCAGPLNNETGIGNEGRAFGRSMWTPPTFTDQSLQTPPEGLEPSMDQRTAPVYGSAGPVAAADAQPSLVSLDRSNWGDTPIDVPSDMSAHQPRFTQNLIIKSSSPRAQGKFPDERTALGLGTHRHNDEQVVEALAAPFVAASDVIMLIPRAIVESRPRQPTRTGGEPYQRWPAQVTIINPPAESTGTPTSVGAAAQSQAPAQPAPSGVHSPTSPQEPPAPRPGATAPRAVPQPPADQLRPGGGMPATDAPRSRS